MTGKQTCAILKEIRRDIAKKNDISIRIEECTHKGACRGTCPRCEAEVKILERVLENRRKRGLQIALAGVSAGILAVGLSSCVPVSGDKPQTAPPTVTGTGAGGGQTEGEEPQLAGMPVMPDDAEGGGDWEILEGDVVAPDFVEGDEDVETPMGLVAVEPETEMLMGEPPVCDYENDGEEDELPLPTAGKPVPEDFVEADEQEQTP